MVFWDPLPFVPSVAQPGPRNMTALGNLAVHSQGALAAQLSSLNLSLEWLFVQRPVHLGRARMKGPLHGGFLDVFKMVPGGLGQPSREVFFFPNHASSH